VRSPKPERAVGLPIDLVPLLVDRAMVPATEQGEVREPGRPALRPVGDVMSLAKRDPAARETAAAVPMVQRAPQRRGDRPGQGSATPCTDHPLLGPGAPEAGRLGGSLHQKFRAPGSYQAEPVSFSTRSQNGMDAVRSVF